MPSDDVSDDDYRSLAEFRFAMRRFLAFSENAARTHGLEPRQHQLLLALRGLPDGADPTVQVLAERLSLKHHSVVELLDRLEANNLIKRTRATDDRRRARITLTARGAELLRKLSRAHLDELRAHAPSLVSALTRVLRSSRTRAA